MAEFNITTVCTVTDPRERQQRWSQAFGLSLDLPPQQSAKDQELSHKPSEQADGDVPTAVGGFKRCLGGLYI